MLLALMCGFLGLLSGSASAQEDDPGGLLKLTITSTPSGASVYIDGDYAGETPYSRRLYKMGNYAIILKKEDYVTKLDTIAVGLSLQEARHYVLDLAATLTLTTQPELVSVYINKIFYGRTPIRIKNLPPGQSEIVLSIPSHYPVTDTLMLSAGVLSEHTYTLNAKPARLRSLSLSNDTQISLNGIVCTQHPQMDTVIAPGIHRLEARQISTGRTVVMDFTVLPDRTFQFESIFNYSSKEPFYSSLVNPGSGQFMTGQNELGTILTASFYGGLGVAITAQVFQTVYTSAYKSDISDLTQVTNPFDAVGLHSRIVEGHENALTAYRVRNVALIVALSAYIYSALDALLIHGTWDILRPTGEDFSLQLPHHPNALTTIQWRIPL